VNISIMASVLALVGTIASGAYFLDDRHAAKDDVTELAGYVSRQFLEVRLDSLRQRLWYLQQNTGCRGPVAAECEFLKGEIEKTLRQMQR